MIQFPEIGWQMNLLVGEHMEGLRKRGTLRLGALGSVAMTQPGDCEDADPQKQERLVFNWGNDTEGEDQ